VHINIQKKGICHDRTDSLRRIILMATVVLSNHDNNVSGRENNIWTAHGKIIHVPFCACWNNHFESSVIGFNVESPPQRRH
jgi:hypothetical protein